MSGTDIEYLEREMIRYKDCLDHVLAVGGLHAQGECVTCDWIRVRPTRAFTNPADAQAALAELAKPRREGDWP